MNTTDPSTDPTADPTDRRTPDPASTATPLGTDPPAAPSWFDLSLSGPTSATPSLTNPSLQQWLVLRRNAGSTPAEIAADLVTNGWDADTAARVSLRSLRSADRQSLTFAATTITAGVGALAAASAAHLMIASNPHPMDLTVMLTVWLVAMPIAVVSTIAARRVEGRSTFVMWSPTRRGWFGALAFCTAAIGVVRLLSYLYLAIATLTGASDEPFSVAAAAQVTVTLAIAIPLFVWSFREWRRSNLVISALTADDSE